MLRTRGAFIAVVLLVNVGIGVLVASLAGGDPVPSADETWAAPTPGATPGWTAGTPTARGAATARSAVRRRVRSEGAPAGFGRRARRRGVSGRGLRVAGPFPSARHRPRGRFAR